MGESVLDWRDFLVPLIVCLLCYWAGGKRFGSSEKRKRQPKAFEYWKFHWQMVDPQQLAELIERGAVDYLTAYRYLISFEIGSVDAEYMLDSAIASLARNKGKREKRKRNENDN